MIKKQHNPFSSKRKILKLTSKTFTT